MGRRHLGLQICSLVIEGATISYNKAPEGFGGIGISTDCSLHMTGCDITHNKFESGKQYYRGCGACVDVRSSAVFIKCNIDDNGDVNYGGADRGGGLAMSKGSKVILQGCSISRNIANRGGKGKGGAIYCIDDGSNLLVEDCVIDNNEAARGGGFELRSGTTGAIKWSEITRNIATNGGGMFIHGGIGPEDLQIEHCIIAKNEASDPGHHGGAGIR